MSIFVALLLPSLIFSSPHNRVFNVLDYGAVGDGSTDATNVIYKQLRSNSKISPI